ncbi:hypothetical protein J6590_053433 [Homalodisca vitripennis]|nr:hypothetical protein J6590_053433 [Homalodisca vitripennis]
MRELEGAFSYSTGISASTAEILLCMHVTRHIGFPLKRAHGRRYLKSRDPLSANQWQGLSSGEVYY